MIHLLNIPPHLITSSKANLMILKIIRVKIICITEYSRAGSLIQTVLSMKWGTVLLEMYSHLICNSLCFSYCHILHVQFNQHKMHSCMGAHLKNDIWVVIFIRIKSIIHSFHSIIINLYNQNHQNNLLWRSSVF